MDPHTSHQLSDRGFTTVQFVATAALALLATVWLMDALVVRYAQGVMGMAATEGARAGSVAAAPLSACSGEARSWLADGLGGAMGDGLDVECALDGVVVSATVTGRFDAWLPGVDDWDVERTASAVREP